jgi:hypothetical protein
MPPFEFSKSASPLMAFSVSAPTVASMPVNGTTVSTTKSVDVADVVGVVVDEELQATRPTDMTAQETATVKRPRLRLHPPAPASPTDPARFAVTMKLRPPV